MIASNTSSKLRWSIAALLFSATLLNYLDREILSIISPVLRVQFNLTATAYSHLLTAFLLGYTILQPFTGLFVDKAGAKRGLMLAMFWWSGAAMMAAASRNAGQMSLFLFLMGVGESANWPASVKAVQAWFAPKERAIAIGIFNCGSSIGAVAAPFIITALTLRYSWHAAFVVSGLLGILWIVPWLLLFRQEGEQRIDRSSYATGERQSWLTILRMRNTLALMGARFFADSLWVFFVFWLPDYLSRSRHFSLARIGMTAWLPFFTAALGNLVGGYFSGLLIRRGMPARKARLRVMSIAAIVMLFGGTVSFVSNSLAALGVIGLTTFAYSCWAANILTLPSDLFENRQIASVVGFSGMAAGAGSIFIMLLVGAAIDHISYIPVLTCVCCLPILGLICGYQTKTGVQT